MPDKTVSERLFEEYLDSVGIGGYTFEAEFPGVRQRPDYSFEWAGGSVVLACQGAPAPTRVVRA